MFHVDIDLEALRARLADLHREADHPRRALVQIGESLVESTKRRIELGQQPDGEPFAPNSPVTIARKGHGRPLIGSGTLVNETINYDVQGDTLIVGSSSEYAAMQQFGGKKAEFPHLWGDIPPRPFLGLSLDDEAMIHKTIAEALERSS